MNDFYEAIAYQGLKSYALSRGINLSLKQATKLAWADGSLMGTASFNQVFTNEDDRLEINRLAVANQNNEPTTYIDSNGNTITVNPIGNDIKTQAPCNN